MQATQNRESELGKSFEQLSPKEKYAVRLQASMAVSRTVGSMTRALSNDVLHMVRKAMKQKTPR